MIAVVLVIKHNVFTACMQWSLHNSNYISNFLSIICIQNKKLSNKLHLLDIHAKWSYKCFVWTKTGSCISPLKKENSTFFTSITYIYLYSRTCLVGTPVRPSKSVPTLQVSPRQRDRNLWPFFPEHTIFIYSHITTYINQIYAHSCNTHKMKCNNITFNITVI